MSTRHSDLNLPTIAAYAILALVILFNGVVWLEAFYHANEEHEITRKLVNPPVQEVVDYHREQEEILSSYRWIDQSRGVVGLPIERAMELVVVEKGGHSR